MAAFELEIVSHEIHRDKQAPEAMAVVADPSTRPQGLCTCSILKVVLCLITLFFTLAAISQVSQCNTKTKICRLMCTNIIKRRLMR